MKIGILGLGSIGLRHAQNLITSGHEVWGYDPDITRSQMLVNIGGNGCTREEAITNVNGIIISSPTTEHLKDIHDSYNLNSIGVFVEKPIAHIMDNEIDWVDMVGFMLRFRSCVIAAKEWIPKIGKPIWANFTVAQYNDKYTDSVILNWSHECDLALYLLGPGGVTACTASGSDGRDDLADILLKHENGCHTAIHLDYLTRPEVRQFIVVGTQATIIADIVHNQAWLRGADEIMWDHSDDVDSFDDNYKDEIQAFIDRIDGKKTIGCTGEEALEVLKICLEAKKRAGL